jgi:hypothetical protein
MTLKQVTKQIAREVPLITIQAKYVLAEMIEPDAHSQLPNPRRHQVHRLDGRPAAHRLDS